jgi:hypothetical protein
MEPDNPAPLETETNVIIRAWRNTCTFLGVLLRPPPPITPDPTHTTPLVAPPCPLDVAFAPIGNPHRDYGAASAPSHPRAILASTCILWSSDRPEDPGSMHRRSLPSTRTQRDTTPHPRKRVDPRLLTVTPPSARDGSIPVTHDTTGCVLESQPGLYSPRQHRKGGGR